MSKSQSNRDEGELAILYPNNDMINDRYTA